MISPDEMRGQAHSLRLAVEKAGGVVGDPEMVALIGNVIAAADALERLADVVEYVEARDGVANYTVNDRLLRIARGETNERETSALTSPICPECRDTKHAACAGIALAADDSIVDCECECPS